MSLVSGPPGMFKTVMEHSERKHNVSRISQMVKCFPMDNTESCSPPKVVYIVSHCLNIHTLYIQLYQQGIANCGIPFWGWLEIRKSRFLDKP